MRLFIGVVLLTSLSVTVLVFIGLASCIGRVLRIARLRPYGHTACCSYCYPRPHCCLSVSNQWARYLLNYLYAVSDEDYDDDDSVSICSRSGIM